MLLNATDLSYRLGAHYEVDYYWLDSPLTCCGVLIVGALVEDLHLERVC